MANYMLPSRVIRLCGELSVIDAGSFLRQAGLWYKLHDQLHAQAEDMSRQEQVCFDHTDSLSSTSFGDERC